MIAPTTSRVGIYWDGESLSVCRVTKPWGKAEQILHEVKEVGEEELVAALENVQKESKSLPAKIGLGMNHALYWTQRTRPNSREPIKSWPSIFASVFEKKEAFEFDKAQSRVGKASFVHLSAVPRSLAKVLVAPWQENSEKLRSVEPFGLAVLRQSLTKAPVSTWKSSLEVRVFRSDRSLYFGLIFGKIPLLFLACPLAQSDSAVASISRSVRQLQELAEQDLMLGPVQTIRIFGSFLNADGLALVKEEAGVPIQSEEFSPLNPQFVAYCLAANQGQDSSMLIHLGRHLQVAPSWRACFPFRVATAFGAILVILTFLLSLKAYDLTRKVEFLESQALEKENIPSTVIEATLSEKKEALVQSAEALDEFFGARLAWAPYLFHIASIMPTNAWVTQIEASNFVFPGDFSEGEKEKYLIIRGAAVFPNGLTTPKEINSTLHAIRTSKMIRKEFPDVTLANVTWEKDGDRDVAFFTIRCYPLQMKGQET